MVCSEIDLSAHFVNDVDSDKANFSSKHPFKLGPLSPERNDKLSLL